MGRIVNTKQVNSDSADAKRDQDQQNTVRPTIRLEYIPLSQAVEWDWLENPKAHDIGGIVDSIQRYGFRDPPEFDATLGSFVQGNGRVKALVAMHDGGQERPLYIGATDDGQWAVPVIFGADAASESAARAFAIDANNLVVTGGDASFFDLMALYDRDQMAAIAALATEPMVTLDAEALGILAGSDQKKESNGLQRWSFVVEFEGEEVLLEELEDLMGMYFMPRSKRKLMPEFFAAMVRSYCADQPVVIVG